MSCVVIIIINNCQNVDLYIISKQSYFHISMIRACKAQFCSAIFILSDKNC